MDQIVSALQAISLVLGVTISILSIGKQLRESGLLRTLLCVVCVVTPIIFLKYVIVLSMSLAQALNLFYMACFTAFVIISMVIITFDYRERRKFESLGYFECIKQYLKPLNKKALSLITLPTIGWILSLIPPPSSTEMILYFSYIQKENITFSLFAYMGKHLLFTAYYVIKFFEPFILGYGLIKGFSLVPKPQSVMELIVNDYEIRNLLIVEAFTVAFISSNIYYHIFVRLSAEFG